jgi:hypothetical protein
MQLRRVIGITLVTVPALVALQVGVARLIDESLSMVTLPNRCSLVCARSSVVPLTKVSACATCSTASGESDDSRTGNLSGRGAPKVKRPRLYRYLQQDQQDDCRDDVA